MTVRCVASGLDYSYEGVSTSWNGANPTAGTFDALVAAAEAVQDAIQGVSLIDYEGLTMLAIDDPRETDQPASPYAQREAKWLVSYSDNVTGRVYSMEIGGPDLTLLSSDGQTMDVSGGAGAALVSALETNVLSRDGNAITVGPIVHVGRNN